MKQKELPYKEEIINSRDLEIPRAAYQRQLNQRRVAKIAAGFDERIANAPKVSYRDGHYRVFDGQHTIAARKQRNRGRDLPILCKVYYGLSESDEALLFAQQTGASARLTAGTLLRAKVYGGDPEAIAFLRATEAVGLHLSYTQARGRKRIICISTALNEFRRVGLEMYQEALRIIVEAWDGERNSLRAEVIQGVVQFVDLYYGEYNRKRLVDKLRETDPLVISRSGKADSSSLPGDKRYLHQVYRIYNGSSKKSALPMKF